MKAQREQARQSWDKFLNPESLRSNVIACSLFIVAWETFRNSTIDHLRGFYNLGFDPDQDGDSEDYKMQVLARHKSPLTASLLWFQESGAIDQGDLDKVDEIRKHRNEIAHELPKYLCQIEHDIDIDLFAKLIVLNAKIGRWWVLEIEVPTNSDFCGQEINADEVQSGDMWFLGLLLQIATGDEAEAGKVYQQFTETWKELAPVIQET